MSSYSYEAVDSAGSCVRGILEVASQSQALLRIKEMGLFPTNVREKRQRNTAKVPRKFNRTTPDVHAGKLLSLPLGGVNSKALTIFTRQLATLLEAGMPLLRGLRLLQTQAEDRKLKSVIGRISKAIEEGGTLSDALAEHPKVFDPLYINLVRAGEASGALETVLTRLARFRERLQRMKGKVGAAMFYPMAVLFVAAAILAVLIIFVVPQFKEVFEGLFGGAPLPAFTQFVLNISDTMQHQFPLGILVLCAVAGAYTMILRTQAGRMLFDRLKLRLPVIGNVFRKAAVASVVSHKRLDLLFQPIPQATKQFAPEMP